mgnify:CR=1 FL=1
MFEKIFMKKEKHTSTQQSETKENPAAEPELDAERAAADMCAEEQSLNTADSNGELDKVREEAAKNKDLYLRAVADLDTYRRKVQREKTELAKFALQPLIEELLPSIDHLDMAIEAAKNSDDSKNILMGVEMVSSQIKKVFANFGVEEIKAEGRDFDPNTSECVSHEPSENVPENGVIKVVRRGYMFNGRLLRPAAVVVSSGVKE